VECGSTTHKVPLRELILNKPCRILDSESDNTEPESSSEEESIPEIIPTRRQRLRLKSSENLVDKSDGELEREMVKIDKRRTAEAEAIESDPEDHQPRLTVWTDSEDDLPNPPTRPKWRKHVYFQNLWGEEFEGYVTDVMKSKDNILWAKVNGESMMIDMNNIKKWKYKEILPTNNLSYNKD